MSHFELLLHLIFTIKMERNFLFSLVVMGSLWFMTTAARAEGVLMPQFGCQSVEVEPGKPLTFYDMKGEEDIASDAGNNSVAAYVFKPATEGWVINVNFEYVDVRNDGKQWYAYVKVYEGMFDCEAVEW